MEAWKGEWRCRIAQCRAYFSTWHNEEELGGGGAGGGKGMLFRPRLNNDGSRISVHRHVEHGTGTWEKLLPEHSQKELVAQQFKVSPCFYLSLLMTTLLPFEKAGHHSVLCCPWAQQLYSLRKQTAKERKTTHWTVVVCYKDKNTTEHAWLHAEIHCSKTKSLGQILELKILEGFGFWHCREVKILTLKKAFEIQASHLPRTNNVY